MKKLIILFLALVASAGIYASDTQVDGIWYDFDDSNNTASVTYKGSSNVAYNDVYSGVVTIPSSVTYDAKNYSVTSIGSDAFRYCTGLTSINIPNSVTSIGDYAFFYCSGLTSVTIPNSVTSIGDYAFSGCSGLTSVTIPNSVTSIGNFAFSICTGLTSVQINDVTAWCAIKFGGYNANPLYYAKHLYLDGTEITDIVIPNDVSSIGDYAFYNCTGLTSVAIPNSVTSIGESAFSGCTGLTSLTINNGKANIGSGVIYGCTGLTSIIAPAGVFDIEEKYWPQCPKYLEKVTVNGGELTDNAFGVIKRSYKTLKSLDVSGVSNTTLADEAFKDFYNVTELVLPANLTSVSYMAVAGCKNLKAIDIPASVEEIDQSAFEDCRSIETITFGGKQPSKVAARHMPAADSKLKRIGNWAFYNAHELKHLEIPEGVEEIGDGAFYGCTYLQDLTLPSSIKAIGDNCFALCSKLQKITVNSATPPQIQARTFYDVSRVIPVFVPEGAADSYNADSYWKEMNIQSSGEQSLEIVDAQSSNRKFLKHGQIFILRGNKIYTATGQEVK